MGPWSPPAKKTNIGRWDGDGPPIKPSIVPPGRWISGKETSLAGLNPSEVFALHRARIEFLNRLGTAAESSGPCNAHLPRIITMLSAIYLYHIILIDHFLSELLQASEQAS